MNRLFLDANVLFTAAHNPRGKAALVLVLGARGHWRAATSNYAAEEARRNIAHKFPDCLDCLKEILAKLETAPASRGTGCPLPLRAKDRPIFEAARRWRATHLLTGDIRDFGPFMNAPDATCGVVIQTVAEFLSEIERG